MSEQATTPNAPAPAPKPPVVERIAEKPPRHVSTEDLMAGFDDGEAAPDDGDQALAQALEGVDVEVGETPPDLPTEEDPEPELEAEGDDSLGSEEEPYTVKTLPKDKFVKVKVDGEEVVVSMAEMADGYIRQETFHKNLNRANLASERAFEYAQRAVREQETLREKFAELINDPDQFYEFMLDRSEDTLGKMARKYAGMVAEWRKTPGARERWLLERERGRFASVEQQRRQAAEAQRQAEEQSRRSEEIRRNLEPGYQQGLKLAGFPKPTKELHEMTGILLEQRRRDLGGKPIGPDDVRDAIVKAAKIIKAETVNERRPAAAPPSRALPPKQRAQAKAGRSSAKTSITDWINGGK